MSVRKNSIANYVGQSYAIIVGIIATPMYLQYLGAEAYGLIGFFSLMQAWMGLLDLGLSPTLGRQVAYSKGDKNKFVFFKRLLKSFELIFFILAIFVILGVFLSSEFIASRWIQAEKLDSDVIASCIALMGVMIGCRWFASLYRSGINGLEDQVWLNGANMIFVSLKFIAVFIILACFTQSIFDFFLYQAFIGFVEVFVFGARFYSKLPETSFHLGLISYDWGAVKNVAPFALSISYTSILWVLVTQTDKLVLSNVLSLKDFAYFSLVALVAGAITTLSVPVYKAVTPRMTMLFSQDKIVDLIKLYRTSSQCVALITFSVALMIGLYSEPLIYAWTGDKVAAEWGKDILILFAVGNGVMAIGAFQYYLQSAFGKLNLHVVGSTISAIIQVPLIYYAAVNYGALGAGVAWLSFRIIWFIWWTPIIHAKLVPGFHLNWLFKDILPVVTVVTVLACCLNAVVDVSLEENRIMMFVQMVLLGCALLGVSSLSLPFVRKYVLTKIKLSRA